MKCSIVGLEKKRENMIENVNWLKNVDRIYNELA